MTLLLAVLSLALSAASLTLVLCTRRRRSVRAAMVACVLAVGATVLAVCSVAGI
jgi:hypothetical protein